MTNQITDDRHLNAIARATEGDEPECDREWRESATCKLLEALKPLSISEREENLRKLREGV